LKSVNRGEDVNVIAILGPSSSRVRSAPHHCVVEFAAHAARTNRMKLSQIERYEPCQVSATLDLIKRSRLHAEKSSG
jgi:hypothetical protein